MNQNLSESRTWVKAARWLALGLVFAVGGCCYSCRTKDSPVAEERFSHAEGFPEEEAFTESEGGTDKAAEEKQAKVSDGLSEEKQEAAADGASEEKKLGTAEAVSGEGLTERRETGGKDSDSGDTFCYVYVCGQVTSPGVYKLEEGQRIFEAVELAGGFTGEARPEYLNLAEPVFDGMKILVPDESQASNPSWNGQIGSSGTVPGTGGSGFGAADAYSQDRGAVPMKKVNINSASKEELMTLTGIGESRAADIIRYRTEQGAFSRIEDIMNVPGIKEASFRKLKDQIEV